ncbi:hypothetical protein GCM10010988_26590 [Cnuibacter physcomitrellae]|uniref:Uncharacterized protein n=1 Tax=Cnuibacter physcomitrellae TaxID=1619308 RepID=A0A1X9LI68_9MICO|nr:hypothetical protein [Cnuibacter physcomitrellae]ARJ03978.1 hypothetical protein B5808_01045 [Cnuibacter physcomitrellae]GGI39939.1 hypothetical protein GCM10010988_26590 [Cnuibacter physcomitrellae]
MSVSFSFPVGTTERHEVGVAVVGLRRKVTLTVDGVVVLQTRGNYGIVMPNVFDIEVGVHERHMVSVRLIFQQYVDGGAAYIDVFLDGRFAFRRPWRTTSGA